MLYVKKVFSGFISIVLSTVLICSAMPLSTAMAIDSETEIQSAMEQINAYRKENGLSELLISDSLNQLAKIRCSEVNKLLSHYRPDSTYFSTIFTEYAIDATNVGESIRAGGAEIDTADKLIEKWTTSDEDSKTILDTQYKYAGLAVTENSNSTYKYNWVLLLSGDSTLLKSDTSDIAKGDLNGDGSIDSSDAVIILSTFAKMITGQIKKTTDSFKARADINEDSEINSIDATRILIYYAKCIAGQKVEL